MTSYEPPTSNLAIFDPLVFQSNDEPLTIAEANKRYLKFPNAQGAETLLDTTINGLLTLNQPNVERILLPAKPSDTNSGANNNLVISNNNNLSGCGNLANSNIVIGRNTLSAFTGTATNGLTKSTIIGHSALASCNASFDNEGITAIGSASLNALTNTTSAQFSANNTGVGSSSLTQFLQGASNTSLGYRSGAGEYYDGIGPATTIKPLFNGSNNTFVGARTGLDATLSNIVQHSTAIGADALITASNQVVLGSATDTVLIPNTLSFANTSTSQKSASDNYTTYTYSTTLSLVDEVIVNTLVSLNPTVDNVNVNIADTANVDFNALSRVSFANISNFNATLRLINSAGNPSSTSTFTGLYGSQLNTIILRPKSQINVFINTTAIGTFVVQDRMPEIIGTTIAYSGTLISLTSPQYFDSRITLTGTVATTVSLPDPRTSVNSFSNNRSVTLINEGSGLLTISSTNGNFGGNHGNSGTTIFLPDNASYTFTSNGVIWEINERSDNITYQNLNVNLASTVSYAGNYNYLGATLNISSTVGGDVIYPAPSDSQAHLTTSIIRNVGLYNINILISTGEFSGKYGKGLISTTYPLPPNSWIQIFSDGTNYRIDERSLTTATILMPSDAFSIATYNYFTDCRLNVSPFSDANILTISSPVNVASQYYNIFNEGQNFTLTLRSVGFDFGTSAKYSNDSNFGNNLTIPSNSWVKLYSDGSVWKVVDKSSDNQIYNYSPAVSFSQNGNLLNNSTTYITPSATGVTYSLITPATDFCDGAYQIIYNKSGIYTLTLDTEGLVSFLGIYGSGASTLIVPPSSWVKLISNGTNWLVDDRSSNFNLYYFETGTDINLTTNFQYLDTTLEFVQPDSVYSSASGFSGTNASQSGYIITITTITAGSGTITAGSVITLSGNNKCILKCQLTGTAGGVGTYLSNLSRSIGATSFTGFGGGAGRVTRNNITTFALGQTTNYAVATFPVTMRPASIISVDSRSIVSPFYIYRQSSGNIYEVTFGAGGVALTGAQYFSTTGTSVRLPTASNVRGRSITIINSSNNPLDITTVAGTSLFTGLYGQLLGSTAVFPNRYLLRPSETVVLKSDGTDWETQVGTSLGGARGWGSGAVTTSASDYDGNAPGANIVSLSSNYNPTDSTVSNLSGLAQVGGVFTNFYPFPITVNVAPNIYWDRGSNSSSTMPIRVGEIRQVTTSVTGVGQFYSPTGITVFSPVPCTIGTTTTTTTTAAINTATTTTTTPKATPLPAYSTATSVSTSTSTFSAGPTSTSTSTSTFTPTGSVNFFASFNGLFTLRSGDTITINVAKINGSGAESVNSSTVYINRVA